MDIIKYIVKVFKRHFVELLFIRVLYFSRRVCQSTSDSDLGYRWVTQHPIVLLGDWRDGFFLPCSYGPRPCPLYPILSTLADVLGYICLGMFVGASFSSRYNQEVTLVSKLPSSSGPQCWKVVFLHCMVGFLRFLICIGLPYDLGEGGSWPT